MSTTSHFLIRYLAPLAGACVALAVLFLLYRDLDFQQFVVELNQAKLHWIVVLALLYSSAYVRGIYDVIKKSFLSVYRPLITQQ